jgi:hypothetical protein
MSRCINKKRFNHQKAHRQAASRAKLAARPRAVLNPAEAIPRALAGDKMAIVTPHQRQAKNSNPGANIKLSKKKLKQIKQRARIVSEFVHHILCFESLFLTFL